MRFSISFSVSRFFRFRGEFPSKGKLNHQQNPGHLEVVNSETVSSQRFVSGRKRPHVLVQFLATRGAVFYVLIDDTGRAWTRGGGGGRGVREGMC